VEDKSKRFNKTSDHHTQDKEPIRKKSRSGSTTHKSIIKNKEEASDLKLYHNGLKRLQKRLGLATSIVANSAYDASTSESVFDNPEYGLPKTCNELGS